MCLVLDVHLKPRADTTSFLLGLSTLGVDRHSTPPMLTVTFRPLGVESLAYTVQHVIVEAIITNADASFTTEQVVGWVHGLEGVSSVNVVAFGEAPVVPQPAVVPPHHENSQKCHEGTVACTCRASHPVMVELCHCCHADTESGAHSSTGHAPTHAHPVIKAATPGHPVVTHN